MSCNVNFEDICRQAGYEDNLQRLFVSTSMRICTIADLESNHFCANIFAVVLCTEGKMRISVDMKDYILDTRKAIIIRPNMDVKIDECEEFTARCIFFNPLKKSDIVISSRHMANFYLSIIRNPIINLSEKTFKQLERIMKTDFITSNEKSYFAETATQHWVMAIIFSLQDSMYEKIEPTSENDSASRTEELFEEFIILCNSNYKRERMVKWYADKMCISAKYLSASIYKFTGKTAYEWICEMVIQEICRQLKYTNNTVQQIAYSMNFPNQSYFGTFFKHRVGCSPGKYRQMVTVK